MRRRHRQQYPGQCENALVTITFSDADLSVRRNIRQSTGDKPEPSEMATTDCYDEGNSGTVKGPDRMSRPSSSVPNQCVTDGPINRPGKSMRAGS